MAVIYVPGPTEIHVGTAQGPDTVLGTVTYEGLPTVGDDSSTHLAQLEFLGYGRQGVILQIDGTELPFHSDTSGPLVAHELLYAGQQAVMLSTINVYNEPVLRKIMGSYDLLGSTDGTIAAGHMGLTLRRRTSNNLVGTFRLLLYCPYASKPAYAAGQMVAAYNFPAATMERCLLDLGTKDKRARCIFKAIPNWKQDGGSGVLYDHNFAGKGPAV